MRVNILINGASHETIDGDFLTPLTLIQQKLDLGYVFPEIGFHVYVPHGVDADSGAGGLGGYQYVKKNVYANI